MKRPSFQFYPGDWLHDSALRMCSIGARGLWIEMLCHMHQATPYGYLKVNEKVILPPNLARMVGSTLEEIEGWLEELEGAGVFSRDEIGCIFSRRMIRDEELRLKRASGGHLGGNPALMKKGKDNLPANLSLDLVGAHGSGDGSPAGSRKGSGTTTFPLTPSSSSSSSEDESEHTQRDTSMQEVVTVVLQTGSFEIPAFKLNDGTYARLSADDVKSLEVAYYELDIAGELRAMAEARERTPASRLSESDLKKYAVSWLRKARRRGAEGREKAEIVADDSSKWPPGFKRVWEGYPRKEALVRSLKAWIEMYPDDAPADTLGEILAGLSAWKGSNQWRQEGGRYVPNFERWLRERRWRETPHGERPKADGVFSHSKLPGDGAFRDEIREKASRTIHIVG